MILRVFVLCGMNFGEVPGVAVDSKGHLFVFTRSNSAHGPAFGPAAAQLLEFGPKGQFIREIGAGLYGWSFAHTVRIDRDDNIWAVDKGSDMIIKFNQAGRVVWVFGRRKESAEEAEPWEHVNPPLPHVDGLFRQPTDVAFDSQGNIYISDGYINARVAKYDRNGDWVKSWGAHGTGPGQFNTPHAIVIDRQDQIYVGCSPSTCLPLRERRRSTAIRLPASVSPRPWARRTRFASLPDPVRCCLSERAPFQAAYSKCRSMEECWV
jgi:streptogramin lyase